MVTDGRLGHSDHEAVMFQILVLGASENVTPDTRR